MSKEGSEVAFIPDNISNISSGKEKFNEDTSQKIQDSYISKLTKFHNNNMDSQNDIEIVDIKSPSPQKFQLREDADPKDIVAAIAKKLASQNMHVRYVNSHNEKPIEKKFILHKYVKQTNELPPAYGQIRRYYHHQTDPYLQTKRTQTDVISEKESFVEEEHEIQTQQDHTKSNQNFVHFDNLAHYESVQESQKIHDKKHPSGSKDKDYTDDLKETFYVTEINKYDEFQTEIGWLDHCVEGNVKHLLRQTNQALDYNKAIMMEIEKVQLRTKIIEIQIQNNKLKIALRKSPSSKHINFSVDLKFKRPTLLRIPKKIDTDMRKYCEQLQKAAKDLRNFNDSNQKELSLLDFYQKQFQQKVTYAYIYQEYLIEKAKRELNNAMNMTMTNHRLIKSSPRKNMTKNTLDSLYLTKSPNRKEKVVLRSSSRNLSSRKINQSSQPEIDESVTSLANRLKSKEDKIDMKKPMKNHLKTQENVYNYEQSTFIRNNKSTQNFIRQTNSQYYTQVLNKTGHNHKLNESIAKRVSLTHHKDLSLPSNQKYIELSKGQINKYFLPLFNTPNRQKKHFYYECQNYLKELEKDYFCQCESQKRNVLLTNENGFRQRQLLRMKTLQMKNQILDTEVDIVTKEKQLKKENQILKKELQLLEHQFLNKYGGQNEFQNQNKMQKTMRSPNKIKNLLPNDYELLYKQAQRRLQTYKSTTMLQSVRPNIPKSRKKISSQKSLENVVSLQTMTFGRKQLQSNNNPSQNSETRTLKKDAKYEGRKMSKSPVLVRVKKSSSKSNKFLNRFKATLSSDFINMSAKQNSPINSSNKKHNPQTTIATERPNGVNISTPQTEFVEEEYYAF